jgi:hypothetical protein
MKQQTHHISKSIINLLSMILNKLSFCHKMINLLKTHKNLFTKSMKIWEIGGDRVINNYVSVI